MVLWYDNIHMCLLTYSGTLDLWYENIHMCLLTHSGTLDLWYDNIHMWIFSNVPLWVLVFATFVYDVSMVQQCECRTVHSKILENTSTCGDQ